MYYLISTLYFVLHFQILGKLLSSVDHNLSLDDIVSIATKAHGFVGADLSAVCKEGGYRWCITTTRNIKDIYWAFPVKCPSLVS